MSDEEIPVADERDELKTEHNFPLASPFKYAKQGDNVSAQFIVLHAPTSKHSKPCAFLKQAFFRALPDRKEGSTRADVDVEEIKSIDGEDIIMMMSQSRDVDLAEVMEAGKNLFAGTNIAMVDGEVKLNQHMLDNMTQDDFEKMLGEYLVNFTLASSLSKMRKTLSSRSST